MFIEIFQGKPEVKAFFTTRQGGVSPAPYDTLNFGGSTPDAPENTVENRRRVLEKLQIKGVVVRPAQVHSDHIACITEKEVAEVLADEKRQPKEGFTELIVPNTDGLITACKDVVLTTVHADCLAVFLADVVKGAVGLVHAGWRGTLAGIAPQAVDLMVKRLGAKKENICASISPGISLCCFEVGKEVYDAFAQTYAWIDECALPQADGKYKLDLKQINCRQLKEQGIREIEISPYCTYCAQDLFFSYRRDQGSTGRMGAGICLA